MRLIAFILAGFIGGGHAATQTRQEYSYPDYSFKVSFPLDPQIESIPGQQLAQNYGR